MIAQRYPLAQRSPGLSRSSNRFIWLDVYIAYSLNFLWSPLLDRVKHFLGQRRGWILTSKY